MDLLKFEARSFVAGGALVAMLWAFAHACALERAPDDVAAVVDAGHVREAPTKRVGDDEDLLEGD